MQYHDPLEHIGLLKHELEQCISQGWGLHKFYALLQALYNATENDEQQHYAALNSSHNNLLTMAIDRKLASFVYALLQAKADPQFVDEKRVSPLNRACWERSAIVNPPPNSHSWCTEIPQMLLHFKADVNALDGNRVTPLFIAVKYANTDLWKLLLAQRDADPLVVCEPSRGQDGESKPMTAVDLAREMVLDPEDAFSYAQSTSAAHFLQAVGTKYLQNVMHEYFDGTLHGHAMHTEDQPLMNP